MRNGRSARFHALPIAAEDPVFRSDWIRDMGEFYGPTLFLAESSATTGGLDMPVGTDGQHIKPRAGTRTARAFGADPGCSSLPMAPSTSNKEMSRCKRCWPAPGDIAIIESQLPQIASLLRMVMAGGQPLYVDAFPMTEYSIVQALCRCVRSSRRCWPQKAEDRLDRVKTAGPDELHVRRSTSTTHDG